MKKLLLITLCLVSVTMSYAQTNMQFNLGNYEKSVRLYLNAKNNDNGGITEYQKFMKENTKRINAEVFQVLLNTDSLSLCLVKMNKGFDYIIYAIESVGDILYDGKILKREPCFFAGSFTYLTKDNILKTVPLYYTKSCYEYWLNDFLKDRE